MDLRVLCTSGLARRSAHKSAMPFWLTYTQTRVPTKHTASTERCSFVSSSSHVERDTQRTLRKCKPRGHAYLLCFFFSLTRVHHAETALARSIAPRVACFATTQDVLVQLTRRLPFSLPLVCDTRLSAHHHLSCTRTLSLYSFVSPYPFCGPHLLSRRLYLPCTPHCFGLHTSASARALTFAHARVSLCCVYDGEGRA